MKTILNLLLMFIVPIIVATIITCVFSLCLSLLTGFTFIEISSYPLVLVGYILLIVIFFFALMDEEVI